MRCWCAKGHAVAGKPPGAALDGRVDSCVVEDGRALLDDGREPAVGCDAGAADGGFGLLRIAWGVGMAAGAVLAEPGSAGLSTGELRTVVASTPEGGGGVVDPVRRSDGATGRHAGGLGRIAGGLGDAGAAVAMALVSRLLGAFAGSDPPSRAGGGDDPARGEVVLAVRAAYALDHEGQGRQAGGVGGSPDGAGRSTSVHPGLALAGAGRRRGHGRSAGGGVPGAVSGIARLQFRPGVPQPRQPTATGRDAGARRVAREGARHGGQSEARESEASFVARRRQHPGVESADPCVGKPWLGPGAHTWPGRLRTHRGYLDPRRQPASARTVAAATGGTAAPSHARTTLSSSGLAVPILNIHILPAPRDGRRTPRKRAGEHRPHFWIPDGRMTRRTFPKSTAPLSDGYHQVT